MGVHTYIVRIELATGGRFSVTRYAKTANQARVQAADVLADHPGSTIVRVTPMRAGRVR